MARYIKFRYVRTVQKQAYHEGTPLFRPECIGVPYYGEAYATDANAAMANLHSWQRDLFYDFRLLNIEQVPAVPKGKFMFTGYQLGHVSDGQ